MTDDPGDIPRWATELGTCTWHEIHTMLDAGHRTMDIVRELSIPDNKVRSLQEYVRRQGPRRRLVQFAGFKDALLSKIDTFGADLVQSLTVIAELAVSNETKAETQVRAFEAMNGFVVTLKGMMAEDAKEEERRKVEETGGPKIDANKMVQLILERYGVADAADDGNGNDG